MVFCTPAPKMSYLSLLHMFTYMLSVFDCGLDGIFTPEDGSFYHYTTNFALWLLLCALITLYCLENLKEPVSLLDGPTQTPLAVWNIFIHLYIHVFLHYR